MAFAKLAPNCVVLTNMLHLSEFEKNLDITFYSVESCCGSLRDNPIHLRCLLADGLVGSHKNFTDAPLEGATNVVFGYIKH